MAHHSFTPSWKPNQKQTIKQNQIVFLGVALTVSVAMMSLLDGQGSSTSYHLKPYSSTVRIAEVKLTSGTKLHDPGVMAVPQQQVMYQSSLDSLGQTSVKSTEFPDVNQHQMKWGPPVCVAVLLAPIILIVTSWKRNVENSFAAASKVVLPLLSMHSLSIAGVHSNTSVPGHTWTLAHSVKCHGLPSSDRQSYTMLNATSDMDDPTMGIGNEVVAAAAAAALQAVHHEELRRQLTEEIQKSQQMVKTLEDQLTMKDTVIKQMEQQISEMHQQTAALQAQLEELETQLKEQGQATQQSAANQMDPSHQAKIEIEFVGGRLLHEMRGHTDEVNAVAISMNKKVLASVSNDMTLRVWDLENGRLIFTAGHEAAVSRIAISLDDELVACGCDDGVIRLWNLNTYEPLHTLHGHTKGVRGLAFSHGVLASGAGDGTIRLWDFRKGILKQILNTDSIPFGLAYSADFTLLSAAFEAKKVVVWDALSGMTKLTLEGHLDWVTAIAMSPNGKLIASGSLDKSIRIWTHDGRYLRSISGLSSCPHCLYFSNDSEWLISGGWNGPCAIWKVTTGELVKEMNSDINGSLAVTPDFGLLAMGTKDFTIKVYGAV